MTDYPTIDDRKTSESMREIARLIDIVLNPKDKEYGFAVLVYPLDQGPQPYNINYVGNSDRADVRQAIIQLILRWDKRNGP